MPLQAGSAYSDYTLRIDDLKRNVAEAKRMLLDLQRTARETADMPAAARGGGAAGAPRGGGSGGDPAQAERQILALANAQARNAQAAGDNARAEQILANALGRVNQSSVAAINTHTRLLTLQRQMQGQSTSLSGALQGMQGRIGGLGSAISAVSGQFDALNSGLGSIGMGLGLAAAAKGTADLALLGSQALLVSERFDGLARSANMSGDALLTALRAASGGEIDDLNLKLSANRAIMLGVADSADEFTVLMQIARDRAQSLGISTQQAFSDLVTGLGRGSAEILDNLAIMVNAEEVYKNYAASVGKSVDALTAAERKQALINAVVEQGRANLSAAGATADTEAAKFARFAAAIDNIKTSAGQLAAINLGPLADSAARVTSALAGVGSVGQGLAGGADLAGRFAPVVNILKDITTYSEAAGVSLARFAGFQVAPDFSPIQQSIGFWAQLIGIQDQATQSTMVNAQATQQATSADSARAAMLGSTYGAIVQNQQADLAASQALAVHSAQLTEDALKAEINAVQSQELAARKSELTAQARASAQALLNSGAAGAAAAARLANSSSLVDQLTAAYYRLLAAQQATAKGSAASVGKSGIDARGQAQIAGARGIALRNQAEETRKQRDADLALARARGNTAQQTAILRQQQQGLNRASAEWKQIEADILGLQSRSSGGGGGGGGGGARGAGGRGGGGGTAAARLSDQDRLNNQILSATERANAQQEDAAMKHQQRLLDIDREFNARRLAADSQFRQSRLDGEASFYRGLGSIKDTGIREQADKEYQAAILEAERRGGDAGKAYLDAQTEIIRQRAGTREEIARARSEGDEDTARYLEGVQQLEERAAAVRLQEIERAGSALESERQRRIDAENRQYEEATGKIADSADRAAQAKIVAAQRSTQAIDAENLALERQRGLLTDIGAARGAPALSPAPRADTPAHAVAQTAAVAAVLDQAVVTAIGSQTETLHGDLAALLTAVQAVERRVGAVEGAVRGAGRTFA